LPEGVEVGLQHALAAEGLAGQEQDEGRPAIEVELAQEAELLERGVGQPMGFVEDQQLRLGGATELGEQRGGGLSRRPPHGGAVADGERADEAEGAARAQGRGDHAEVAWRPAGAERTEQDGLPRARRGDEQGGAAGVDGEVQPLERLGEARVGEHALGRHGPIERQRGEAEMLEQLVDGRHREVSFPASARAALR
jgi:hypothetical protein